MTRAYICTLVVLAWLSWSLSRLTSRGQTASMCTMVPLPTLLVGSYTLLAHAATIAIVTADPEFGGAVWATASSLAVLSVTSLAGVVIAILSRRRQHFRIAEAVHVAAALAILLLIGPYPAASVLIAVSPVLLAGVFEPYPASLVWIAVVALGSFVTGLIGDPTALPAGMDGIARALTPGVIAAVAGVATAAGIRYREEIVTLQENYRRLDSSIDQMTRANQEYQDTLIRVEAEAIEAERKRITRDIHDVVGYTLTNNIMLMEAATDVARTNPIGVTRLLNMARENAEGALQGIRQTLYGLRLREESVPHGIAAIVKLISGFEAATGISVTSSFTNTPVHLPQGTESALYHLVQESMTNSFRHGHATRIEIVTAVDGDAFRVYMSDNGVGASDVTEGIGLKGMTERIGRLGGTLSYRSTSNGFIVSAELPWRNKHERAEDPHPAG